MIADCDAKIKALDERRKQTIRAHAEKAKGDAASNRAYDSKLSALRAQYTAECAGEASDAVRARNQRLTK